MNQIPSKAEQKQTPRLKLGHIFWGLILVLLGTLFLLQNFNVMAIDFGSLWRLWPVFIIAAGVSMFTFRGWLGAVKFLVPKDSGVSLRIDLGMSSKNIPGMHEVSSGYFETDNYSSAAKKIRLNGHIGMAGLDIQYY